MSAYALVQLTQILFAISNDFTTSKFVFFGTIVGYNFVKYDALARPKKVPMTIPLKGIVFLSFLSLIATGYYFFQLQKTTQIIGFVFMIITLLYTVPFFPNQINARNWAGIKIYIVSLCWVGVTLLLPILNNNLPFTHYFFLVTTQRFILIFVLVLIFEIIDLKFDDTHLKTVPQQIGVVKTKKAGVLLMIFFVLVEFFSTNFRIDFFILKLCLTITTILFLLFSNENRSRYYASFWVESIPIFWWLFLMFFK
ncbi:hypothetical protein CLV55_102210 [Flavobacterium aciduliphilum]|uniref:UbiA prenyltransferase family protein n=1 Tax=Flavobacterium aciduliphilum TaxID=1101402 RepID=A0A328YW26_9FLAO|nr:hypothetical protein CLV55_102210 [Flavobacterium aciduliphilum]